MRIALITAACLFWSCAHSGTPRQPFRDARCLVLRGCPAPASIPRCDASAATAASEAEPPAEGSVVAIRGRLEAGAVICTQALCPARCCNECHGSLSVYDGRRHVELVGPGWSVAGDDSAICYGRGARDAEVLVRGTLRTGRDGVAQLVVAGACAP